MAEQNQAPQSAPPAQEQQQVNRALNDPQEPTQIRSNLLLTADRYVLERDIMGKLEAGAGPFGNMMIDLEKKKRDVCQIEAEKNLPKHKDMLSKLAQDGFYVEDPEVNQKFNDSNIQKLEERLLNNNMSEFFHMNGELKLDNDLLADQITRPTDLAFEQTMAFQKREVNAILSDRLHSYKKKYFRLDVIVGKMDLFNCEDHFDDEDELCLKMKEQFKAYETQVSLAMIPFYQQRWDHLNREIQERENDPSSKQEELEFLARTCADVVKNLDKEKAEVQLMAQELYDTWLKICNLRQEKKYAAASAHLKVYRREVQGETEYSFALINENPSEKMDDGSDLPQREHKRKGAVEKINAFCKLIINGKYVSQTRKKPVSYPIFEVEFGEVFQVNVFTMPSSIQLELYVNKGFRDQLVDVVDIEVPGQHVKALTCACQLIQEINFSKFERENLLKPKSKLEDKLEEDLTAKEKKKRDADRAKVEKARQNDINGQIYVKAEWKGNGPKMPPIKSENLFKKPKAHKNRLQYSLQEETLMLLKQLYIDVNDPRNERIIKILKESKNEFFIKLLADDAKNMLADAKPFRHRLLQLRNKEPDMTSIPIPMLESEIIDSSKSTFFLDKLEKMFRDEAYLVHLQARIQQEKQDQGGAAAIEDDAPLDDFNVQDKQTIQRRQLIFDALKDRQNEASLEGSKGSVAYKSVVNEFELEAKNPLQAIFSKIFIGGRKLKPVVKERTAVAFESVEDCKIHVHVIKGENVPVRREIIQKYRDFNQNQSNNRGMPRENFQASMRKQNDDNDNIEDRQAGNQINSRKDLQVSPQVESYVEVKIVYGDGSGKTIIDRTFCDEGKDPKWNEVKSFPFKPVGSEKFTKEQLVNDDTVIYISLFDRQQYRQQQEGKQITQEEHRFLGSMTVPLQTVLQNPNKMEFNFMIQRPVVLPSYNVLKEEIYFLEDNSKIDEQQLRKNEQIPTYLNLSISMDPPLELPSENEQTYYPGGEAGDLLTMGSQWVLRNKKWFKESNVQAFGENISGHSILLCRYLCPIMPPKEVVDLDQNPNDQYAIERAARFVAMIPFVDDLSLFKDMPDVFSTCQEFLDLGGGDYEEHAILLANYFQYIDNRKNPGQYKSYIVFGEAYPEGRSVFVMRKYATGSDHSIELWGPLTGICYHFSQQESAGMFGRGKKPFLALGRVLDPVCPMRKIHCVVSDTNIWANCQKHDTPVLMNFDFNNIKMWKPLFENEKKKAQLIPSGIISTIQSSELQYASPSDKTQSLELHVQKYIVEQFQEERIKRVRKTTKWQFSVKDDLRNILVSCEEQAQMARKGGKISKSRVQPQGANSDQDLMITEIIDRMDQITEEDQKNKRVWGFPLNTSYTSLDDCWKIVEQTKMHMVNRQDVEFSIAVHIVPYPANVKSVWIYMAAFIDKTMDEMGR